MTKKSNAIVAIYKELGQMGHSDTTARCLNFCLEKGLEPKAFKQLLRKFDKNGFGLDNLSKIEDKIDLFLCNSDIEQIDFWKLPDFYKKAIKNGADRFIGFGSGEYEDIIAIRGKPSAESVVHKLFGKPKNKKEAEDFNDTYGNFTLEKTVKQYFRSGSKFLNI